MKKRSSIHRKMLFLMVISFSVMVVFSVVISYIFYSNPTLQGGSGDPELDRRIFFMIFSGTEILAAVLLAFVGTVFMEMFVTKPIKRLTQAIESIEYGKAEDYDERDSKQSRLGRCFAAYTHYRADTLFRARQARRGNGEGV